MSEEVHQFSWKDVLGRFRSSSPDAVVEITIARDDPSYPDHELLMKWEPGSVNAAFEPRTRQISVEEVRRLIRDGKLWRLQTKM